MAFRINSPQEALGRHKDKNIVEGFDNSELEGCGEKLLHLLQRVAVENILVIGKIIFICYHIYLILVAVWYYGFADAIGIEVYSHVINITRELLTSLHDQALEIGEEAKHEGEGDENDEELNNTK